MSPDAKAKTRRRTVPAAPVAKRVDIVRTQLVRDKTLPFAHRVIDEPFQAATLFRDFVGDPDREHFVLLCLNKQNEPTHLQVVNIGTLDGAHILPREVLKAAILASASSFIVMHNHVSGRLHPSEQDLTVTRRLKEAGELIGIPLTDHVIVGPEPHQFESIRHHHPL